MPNKLSQFWQELMRRKVVRVITVYAAAAFVILELVDIIKEPFGLPDWTMILVVVLLTVGFIIAVILSWIYDIHPEGGIVKTEPSDKVKAEDVPQSSNNWKIASYISFVVIVALIVLNVIPRTKRVLEKEILDKSIAILPFINDSPEETEMYFINGTMESILDKLCKIEDLRVVSRTSVEQYRNNPKPMPTVAEEMNVSYVIEGSGLKHGDNIRLTIQLIDAVNDRHIWSNTYNRKTEEIFELQSEIAQLVAGEIRAVITPEEKQLIEKSPTTSLTALGYYQRGREELSNGNIENAEDLFHETLRYDSTFAQAYTGLAWTYWSKNYWDEYLSESFLDSVLILAEIALDFDYQLSEAYVVKGRYYYEMGDIQLAEEEFDKAIHFNPNDWNAYRQKAFMYFAIDNVKYIENLQQATLYNRGPDLPRLYRAIGIMFYSTGFDEKGNYYLNEALKLEGDSLAYLLTIQLNERNNGNYERAIQLNKMILNLDSNNVRSLAGLGYLYSFIGEFEESVRCYRKWADLISRSDSPEYNSMHRRGYAYFMNGQKEEASYFFDKQIEYSLQLLILDRSDAIFLWPYYDLAGVYAFRGEREKVYENLKKFNQRKMMPRWMAVLINDDPLFDSIRDEPEFQQIVRDVEAKYQAEHERVRQWLEENDML